MTERFTLQLPSIESAMSLSGYQEDNLKILSQQTGAQLVMRGQELFISGTANQIELCQKLIESLKEFWKDGKPISSVDILTARHAINTHQEDTFKDLQRDVIAKTRRGLEIRAKTFRQRQYIQAMRTQDLIFCIGPAGTGKTYLAAILALQALLSDQYERLILTRPAVEAGEKLGFLPGDLQQKVNPYLRPLYDALYELIDPEKAANLMERGVIEVAPIAYMRGRTLNNSFIILDEAQNTTPEQMKMFLTRLGFGSKMIITGDTTQVDLPNHAKSGLKVVQDILDNIEDIAFMHLTAEDVVRNRLVGDIVTAYGAWDENVSKNTFPLRNEKR